MNKGPVVALVSRGSRHEAAGIGTGSAPAGAPTRRRRFYPSACLALVLTLPLFSAESVSGQEEVFLRANQLYQEGDFSGALEAYRTLLEAGFESADLHYNLGNAHFKTGDLGRSILSYERALRLRPRDPDSRANLELARSLTADEIEPLPRFWVLSVLSWWIEFIPRTGLIVLVALGYTLAAGGLCLRILYPPPGPGRLGGWVAAGAAGGLLLFGLTLLARQGVLAGTDWGVILVEEVAVQSAPSSEDDLTLFRVHEGTKVRIDQDTDTWLEIVLEDGRVGWIPSEALEMI